MRLVTLNTWKGEGSYRQRLSSMAHGLASLAPDAVLLQEALVTADGQADTAEHLAHRLGMQHVAAPARRKPRLFEGQLRMSSSGLALLVRTAPVASQVVVLPTAAADGERIAQIVAIEVAGQRLWLANLHLTHLPGADALRHDQLMTCLIALRHCAGDEAAVVGGDLNSASDSAALAAALRQPWNFSNPFSGQRKTTHRDANGRDLDLDHLLLSPGWPADAVRSAFVALDPREAGATVAASDHAAVVVDLAWPWSRT
jgi:endonuclease/exonuclease/phosphatase family metal-dependent hydrolase